MSLKANSANGAEMGCGSGLLELTVRAWSPLKADKPKAKPLRETHPYAYPFCVAARTAQARRTQNSQPCSTSLHGRSAKHGPEQIPCEMDTRACAVYLIARGRQDRIGRSFRCQSRRIQTKRVRCRMTLCLCSGKATVREGNEAPNMSPRPPRHSGTPSRALPPPP